jgi:hypothetical protein
MNRTHDPGPDDPLASELASLRPRAVSADLARGVAARLDGPGPRPRQRTWIRPALVAAATGAVAATVGLGGYRGLRGPTPQPDPARVEVLSTPAGCDCQLRFRLRPVHSARLDRTPTADLRS